MVWRLPHPGVASAGERIPRWLDVAAFDYAKPEKVTTPVRLA